MIKRSSLVSLVLGSFLTLWASAPAEAVVITDVKVVIGGTTWTSAVVGWSFPVTLQQGQDLVLTQNTGGFSFDTSDVTGPLNIPEIHVTADGKTTVHKDLAQILNTKGVDIPLDFPNEAQEYGLAIKGKGYQLFLGYADNTHWGPCGGWANSIGLNGAATCLPTPFFGATYFQGTGAFNPGLPQINPFHCDGTGQVANCYEGGVLRILAVPEPATMALLLTGAALIGMRRYRLRRPN